MNELKPDSNGFLHFRFHKDYSYPVLVKVGLPFFNSNLSNFLLEMGLIAASGPEKVPVDKKGALSFFFNKKRNEPPPIRETVLVIKEATPKVKAQIGTAHPNDGENFGPEKITPGRNYNVYCYQGKALMIYSKSINEWELALHGDFGLAQDKLIFQTVIVRFLSLALAPHGLVGLWGTTTEDGILAQRPREAKGMACFIDLKANLVLSPSKSEKWGNMSTIYHLDPSLYADKLKMSREELLSFLFSRCTYFDYGNYPLALNNSLVQLSKLGKGVRHSPQKFHQRSNLSY